MQTPETIQLYGRTYARNAKACVASLFDAGGTASGTYRATTKGIYLSDLRGNERVFIRADGLGPVTVFRCPDGKRRYMFSTSDMDEKQFGIPDSYTATVEGARKLAASIYNP